MPRGYDSRANGGPVSAGRSGAGEGRRWRWRRVGRGQAQQAAHPTLGVLGPRQAHHTAVVQDHGNLQVPLEQAAGLEGIVLAQDRRIGVGEVPDPGAGLGLPERSGVDQSDVGTVLGDDGVPVGRTEGHGVHRCPGPEDRRRGVHHLPDGEVLHLLMDLRGGLLGPATQVHERPDEHQPDVDQHARPDHDHGEHPRHPGGDLGGPAPVAVLFEQRPEDPPAVEGEGRQEVEGGEHQVDPGQPGQDLASVEVRRPQRGPGRQRRQREHQRQGRAGRGPGGGDAQLHLRVVGQPGHLGDATDGQEVDLGHGDPVALGHEAVGELVEHDAGEEGNEPGEAGHHSGALRRRGGQRHQAEQEQEGGVDPDVDPGDGAQPHREARPAPGRHGLLRGDQAVVAVVA